MWCNNCLLLFPLRGGAIALALFIAAYSIAGAIFLFLKGDFLYFTYPEPQLYGGIGITVGILALINIMGMSNNSYMWTRLMFYLGPFILFIGAVRAGLMVFRLDYYQSNIIWECAHGGQLYNATLANNPNLMYNTTTPIVNSLPSGFCSTGFHSLYLAFAFALVVDMILQIYMWFMTWRFKAQLEQYFAFKSNNSNGIYTA